MILSELLSDLGDTVRSGDKIRSVVTARRMNAIIGAIKALARGENIIGGPGVRVKTASSAGVVLIGNPRTQAGDGYVPPFTCSVVDGRLYIAQGYVNKRTPTIDGVALDNDPVPSLQLVAGRNRVYFRTRGSFVFEGSTGLYREPETTQIVLNPDSAVDVVDASGWTAFALLAEVTMAEDGDALAPDGEVRTYFAAHLTAGNYGFVNAYF